MSGPPPVPPAIEGQTYCLRWNNHKSNLVEILDALIKVESYVDCTIVVDDQVQFKAHRVVLAANSPYFQAILQNVPMDHCSIIFPGVKAFEMRALLEYMYTGEVNVTQSQIPNIMRIAEELEVKGLFDMADLKEKFHKMGTEEQNERLTNPYSNIQHGIGNYGAQTMPTSSSSSSMPSSSSSSTAIGTQQNGGNKDNNQRSNNTSQIMPSSTNQSPPAAPTSSSSPPYNYKSPFANLYTKSPGPSSGVTLPQSSTATATTTLTSSSHGQSQQQQNERTQWPLSPSAAAAAMLSSVYESAPDMNPLKRKKLSSLSSMLMNRDTPILRNVLAQANPVDPSHTMPLMLPGSTTTTANPTSGSSKTDKIPTDKNPLAALTATSSHNNNHSFNGSDYSSEKFHEEPHSPYTDRSFDDDSFDQKGNFTGNFGPNNANQKPEWKRYKQYTRNDINSAIQAVAGGMSALQAARKYGVPSRTLYDKVKKLGITTGRPMNRSSMKRSPSNMDSSAAFPYAHGYGQAEPLSASMQESHDEREREKEHHHHRSESHHLPPNIPHPAAALLDHAFLQQALENRGGDMVAGREALHAMALAAAAHAAANRMSASPRHHENEARSPSPPSPNYGLKYSHVQEHEMMMAAREKERELDDEEDQVEDLSVARKDCLSPDLRKRAGSPYTSSPPSPPPPTAHRLQMESNHDDSAAAAASSYSTPENGSGSSVIVPPLTSKLDISSSEEYAHSLGLKRELIDIDERHAD